MAYRRPPANRESMISLRLDNLPYQARMEDLRPLFEKYGEIGDIYLPMDRESGRSRGFGFVRYHERRDAEVEIIDGRETDLPD